MAAWGNAEKNVIFFGFTPRGSRNANHRLDRFPLIQFASNLGVPLSLPLLLGNEHPALLDLLATFLENTNLLSMI